MTDKDIQTIVEDVNYIRKLCKNTWYSYEHVVFGIKLKGYNTWIQKIERDQFKDGSPMNMTIKQFKEWLTNWLKETDNYVTS